MERALTFDGRAGLVTGAGQGIGRASALAFTAAGARVAVIDVNMEQGLETVELIERSGGEAFFHKADIAIDDEVKNAVDAVISRYGRLDFAHNNAGVGGSFDLTADYPSGTWRRVVEVNLTGTFTCVKYEVQAMLINEGGAIVNTGSTASIAGMPSVAYTASKHGIAGLTRTAAVEYASRGVRVNCILPGIVDTPLTAFDPAARDAIVALHPNKRVARADEIAQVATWLCSDLASIVTGAIIPADGGFAAGVTPAFHLMSGLEPHMPRTAESEQL